MAKYWFKPKQYGYGAGLPTSWEGWALLAGYLALVFLIVLSTPVIFGVGPGTIIGVIATTIVTIPFVILCALRTEGGWRWKWGGD